ncbi:predicted protein [Sclerotinia sclerotiorum 1980 UF-70]|uniref:Uncharacterized protein n=1 Tax=Sclerotinia sclerotiorum (strain ATCC 18683 / 1980 / Ss-1) TaxID=665079 RepID=A7ECB0_SCLS1|nr:predicted protein [Sclerotinia sclerotiorum 1980 UF-70]EDO00089.1 predicted protein [Sclerotinia sclerotiorum 1980 UF-70]
MHTVTLQCHTELPLLALGHFPRSDACTDQHLRDEKLLSRSQYARGIILAVMPSSMTRRFILTDT